MVSVHIFPKWTRKQMDWQLLDSKMFAAMAYAPETGTLHLRFRDGGICRYFDFPEAQYQEFFKAESRDRYFLTHIRGRFRYQCIAQSNST